VNQLAALDEEKGVVEASFQPMAQEHRNYGGGRGGSGVPSGAMSFSSLQPFSTKNEDEEESHKDSEGFLTGQTLFVGRSDQQFHSSFLTKWWNSEPVSIKVRLVAQP